MTNNFDPYDMLIQLDMRLSNLEIAHNRMADAFHKTEKELTVALHALRNAQIHLANAHNKIRVLETRLNTNAEVK